MLRSAQVPHANTAGDWARFSIGLDARIQHYGCTSKRLTAAGVARYDQIVTCLFTRSDALTRRLGIDPYEGLIEFGIRQGTIRGIFVVGDPELTVPVDDFNWWVETQRKDVYDLWSPDERSPRAIPGDLVAEMLVDLGRRLWRVSRRQSSGSGVGSIPDTMVTGICTLICSCRC